MDDRLEAPSGRESQDKNSEPLRAREDTKRKVFLIDVQEN